MTSTKELTNEEMKKSYAKFVSLLNVWRKRQRIWKKAGDRYQKLYKDANRKYTCMLKVVKSPNSSAAVNKSKRETYKKAVRAEKQALRKFKAEGAALDRVGKPLDIFKDSLRSKGIYDEIKKRYIKSH